MHNKMPILAAGGLLAVWGISGCGISHPSSLPARSHRRPSHKIVHKSHHHHTSAQVYVPKSTSVAVDSSPGTPIVVSGNPQGFPHIMVLSMQSLPNALKSYALAPMEIPWPENSSKVMYYDPTVFTPSTNQPGLQSGYSVLLTAPLGRVASFSTELYGSEGEATAAVLGPLQAAHLSFPASGPDTSIGSGLSAQRQKINGQNILGWHEGQWSIVVAEPEALPLTVATEIAAYLHQNYLPAPFPEGSGVGLIFVTETPSGVTSTTLWQENRVDYQVSTYPATAKTVVEDLSMVVGMKKYFG